MIVKIAKAARTFAGVNYNEKKNEHGTGELLVAANFAINPDNMKKSDLIAYMEHVCATNKAVKNKQFHAIISCKGREYSVDELKDIALKYIDKMGYGKNPYLIYFHSDTEHNHVHIVSTRVGKDGVKINDKMEAVRSQRIMNEILRVDLSEKAKRDITNAFSFNFSSIQQYKLLLEQQGWKLTEQNNVLKLRRGGEVHAILSIDEIHARINAHRVDNKRKDQIIALLHKYKQGLSYTQLQELIKNKFGIELIFHVGKGHTIPYGYTVIDYPNKTVYKGSELMEIKSLITSPDTKSKIENCNSILNAIFRDNHKSLTMEDLQAELKKYGYSLMMDGRIVLQDNNSILLRIDKDVVEQLRYHSRCREANSFKITSADEAKLLAKIYNIKLDDVIILQKGKEGYLDKSIYVDMLNSYVSYDSDIRSTMHNKNLVLIESNDKIYLIDKKEKIIVSSDEFSLTDFNKSQVKVNSLTGQENGIKEIMKSDVNAARGCNIIDVVCDILGQHIYVQQDSSNRRKKKRSQQQ